MFGWSIYRRENAKIRFPRFYLGVIELDLIGSRFFVFRYYRIELRFFMDSFGILFEGYVNPWIYDDLGEEYRRGRAWRIFQRREGKETAIQSIIILKWKLQAMEMIGYQISLNGRIIRQRGDCWAWKTWLLMR